MQFIGSAATTASALAKKAKKSLAGTAKTAALVSAWFRSSVLESGVSGISGVSEGGISSVTVQTAQRTAPQRLQTLVWLQAGTAQRRFWRWNGQMVDYLVAEPEGGTKADTQTLLLVHGFGAFAEHWRRNVPDLAKQGYRCVATASSPVLQCRCFFIRNAQQWAPDCLAPHARSPTARPRHRHSIPAASGAPDWALGV